MNDRELLTLSALAAGYKLVFSDSGDGYIQLGLNTRMFNPLVDDGEALRLACFLGLDIFHDSDSVTVKKFNNFNQTVTAWQTEYGALKSMVPTRRAIVIVAAEIGRGMQ